jgi:hypothetical protein
MGLFRLIIIFIIGYFIVKIVKRFLQPGKSNPNVQGKSKQQSKYGNNKNIQDIDYEELE